MAILPKISHPTFPLLVPSHKRAFRFRPFTVKEEKLLLMAKESTEEDPRPDWYRAIHQVVSNCVTDTELNVDTISTFDLEWLFLKIRESSAGQSVPLAFIDKEEREKTPDKAEPYTFQVKLADVHAPELPEDWLGYKIVQGGENDSVMLRYPPAVLYTDPDFAKDDADTVLYRATNQIMSSGQTFNAQDFKKEEVIEYYDSWQAKDMEKVYEFLSTTPSMKYEIKYTNKFGSERSIVLSSLSDFFPF